jgi:methyl-accepting chemotaxis protein
MTRQIKLRTRMLLGYTTPAVFYVIIGTMAYTITEQVFKTFEEVEKVQNVIIEMNNMSLSAQEMVRSSRGYIINKNETFFNEYQEGFKSSRQSADLLAKEVKVDEQKQRVTRMLDLVNEYYEGSNELFRLVRQGKQGEALAIFNTGKYTRFVEEFDGLTDQFNKHERDRLQKETNAAKESLTFLRLSLLIGSLLLLLFAIIVAWLIAGGVAGTINQAINAIAISSTEIATTVEEQERMATQQATSVHETTTTMDELGASSQVTAEQIETAVAQARQALSLAYSGTKAIGMSLDSMNKLKTKVEKMQEQIVHLSEQTGQIGNISTVVSDLANQTNMLALNAAVEAVRAGENGKGFAVVATEIRKLADQSKKSATQIYSLVADIQDAINSTVMVTDEGTKTVEDGSAIAQETAQVFASMSDSINNIVVNSQQILLNAKQQAIAIQQVVDAMNSLNQAAAQAANGVTQTKIGTKKLNEAALDLQAII